MAIFFRNGAKRVVGQSDRCVVARPPGVVEGDVMVAFIVVINAGFIQPVAPSGWTLVDTFRSAEQNRVSAYVKPAGVGEPSDYTWTIGETLSISGAIVAYTGADTADPVDVSDAGEVGGPSTIVAPSVDTTADNSRVVIFGFSEATWTITEPTGTTMRVEAENPGTGSLTTFGIADFTQADLGATGTRTFSTANGQDRIGLTVALRSGNEPPFAPTVTAPSTANIDQGTVIGVGFSDPDPGDTPSAAEIRFRDVAGDGTWTSIYRLGAHSSVTIPAGTLTVGDWEVQGRSTDELGEVGPWSGSVFFAAASPPDGPTITDPLNGATIPSETYTGTISYPSMDSWEFRVLGDLAEAPNEADVIVAATTRPNTSRTFTMTNLPNDTTVHVQVRTEVATLWSVWVSHSVRVTYTPPAQPVIETDVHHASGMPAAVVMSATQPAPAGNQPAPTIAGWERQELDENGLAVGDPILLAQGNGLAPTAEFIDWQIASKRDYRWRQRVWAGNGTSTYSLWSDGSGDVPIDLPDTTAPSVPTGVDATATGETTVHVTWGASIDLDGTTQQSAIRYRIYRDGIAIATTIGGATSYNDSGLTAGTTYSYTVAALDEAGNLSGQSTADSATTDTATVPGDVTYDWQVQHWQGGGNVTGLYLDETTDITYARTDVGGAFRRATGDLEWEQLLDAAKIGPTNFPDNAYSVAGVAARGDHIYMSVGNADNFPHASLVYSHDNGATWAVSGLAGPLDGNGSGKRWYDRIAIDPRDPLHILVGHRKGIEQSFDGGATFARVVTPRGDATTAAAGGTQVLFDHRDGAPTSGGRTLRFWCAEHGADFGLDGFFRTDDGGSSWTRIQVPDDAGVAIDEPLLREVQLLSTGDMLLSSSTRLWRITDPTNPDPAAVLASASLILSGANPPVGASNVSETHNFTVDPANEDTVIVFPDSTNQAGSVAITYNASDPTPTWKGLSWTATDGADGTVWFAPQSGPNEGLWSDVRWQADDVIWVAGGFGVTSVDGSLFTAANNPDSFVMLHNSRGIEEVVIHDLHAVADGVGDADGRLLAAAWDKNLQRWEDPEDPLGTPPTQVYSEFDAAWSVNGCRNFPANIAVVIDDNRNSLTGDYNNPAHALWQKRLSGMSTDGGQTFLRFPALVDGSLPTNLKHGNIAISATDPTKLVWLPLYGGVHYSHDSGATWTASTLPAAADNLFWAYHLRRKALVADAHDGDTFFMMNQGGDGFYDGVWKSVDGGITWAVVNPDRATNGLPSDGKQHATWMAAVDDGASGTILACAVSSADLRLSTDGGVTFTSVPACPQAVKVAVGAPAVAGGPETIWVAHRDPALPVGTQPGCISRSLDGGDTWEIIGRYPLGRFDTIAALAGDPDDHEQVYIGYGGGSGVISRIAGAATPVAAYPAAVLADNPLAYWRLGEDSGTSSVDATGNGNTLTHNGSPTLGHAGTTSDGDTAVDYRGTEGYSTTVVANVPLGGEERTYEVRLLVPDTLPAGDTPIFYHGADTTGGRILLQAVPVDVSTFRLRVNWWGGYREYQTLTYGEAHHICVLIPASATTSQIVVSADAAESTGTLVSGSDRTVDTQAGEWRLAGTLSVFGAEIVLDEPAVYDHRLTAARIQAHIDAAGGTPESNDPLTIAPADALLLDNDTALRL